MIRIRHLAKFVPDPMIRQKLVEKLAEQRGFPVNAVPEWFELDDADFVDLMNEVKQEMDPPTDEHDSRE